MEIPEDIPDLSSDEEGIPDDDWEEMDESTSSNATECLFCKDMFMDINAAFDHCKLVHNFDMSALKTKHCMDFYSYIKLITYIRSTKADALSIMTALKPLWDDEKYLKPVKQEEWLTFDFDSLNEGLESPTTAFHANVENGLVTLSEAHFTELQRTIQSLTSKLKETRTLLDLTREDMETMKKSMHNIINDSDGSAPTKSMVVDCVHKVNLDDDEGYFNTYAHYGIHHDMLFDRIRTESYKKAILGNCDAINGKCVLDLGCGTGILSMFSASAGAAKVLAIDQSDIIYNAMDIVRENKLENKIKIIKGRLENIDLNEKVDIIVSEWMGYFLLFEGMLDSVIYARDHYLKPGGLLIPNKCTISLVGSGDLETHSKYIGCWSDVYGYRMNCMKGEVIKEANIDVASSKFLTTTSCVLKEIDMNTCTVNSVNFSSEFALEVLSDGHLAFFIGYFDTFFDLPNPISFSTGPEHTATHWKQTIFYLKEPVVVKKGDVLKGSLTCNRNMADVRGLIIQIGFQGKFYKYTMS